MKQEDGTITNNNSIDNNSIDNSININMLYSPSTMEKILVADVIIPVKYAGTISYVIPDEIRNKIHQGMWVIVDLSGKKLRGIIERIYEKEVTATKDKIYKDNNITLKEIEEILQIQPVSSNEIIFWKQISDYYMCTAGEILKSAYPESFFKQEQINSKNTPAKYTLGLNNADELIPNNLSGVQQIAYNQITETVQNKPVLLYGVTGSGKTEIYINLAIEAMKKGKQVLFMVPEISLSRQLQARLKKVFGELIVTYHSQQTPAKKHFIHKLLTYNPATDNTLTSITNVPNKKSKKRSKTENIIENNPYINKTSLPIIVLGTRSSLFLPFTNLGLVIVDEEHDTSYKQTEPNPRYNGRDTALLLAKIHNANIVMGSATPSLETLYNVYTDKFGIVELNNTFYGAEPPQITIIDTLKARITKQMNGNFSQQLINILNTELNNNGQILIFRNRRSYSPQIECFDCGHSPMCPHCNVHLSYHKNNNRLYCHHCEYSTRFAQKCEKCGSTNFIYRGAGTEKIEEELINLFPDKKVARYDSDTAKSIQYQQETLKAFSNGEIDILVGTQMISKGFDFPHLSLVVVMHAETMVSQEDFRADERAIQLLKQVMGRTGRRDKQGKFVIQTSCIEHPVFTTIKTELAKEAKNTTSTYREYTKKLLAERKEYNFAPFVRMIKLIVKHKNIEKLNTICNNIKENIQNAAQEINYTEITGPFSPAIDKIRGEYIKCFYIKFTRKNAINGKHKLLETLSTIKGNGLIICDVDPL